MKYLLIFFMGFAASCYGQVHYLPMTKLVPVKKEASFEPSPQPRSNPKIPRWSPPAEHHKAVVRVSCPSGAGTGVKFLHTGKGVMVLTNRHVVRIGDIPGGPVYSEVTIRSYNGNQHRVRVIATSQELDLALLQSDTDVWTNHALPLGNFEVPLGYDIELVGYGGPSGNTLRHVYGERLAKMSINAITISGDSGSPLVYGGAIVGINYGGRGAIGQSNGWPLIYPASSFASGPVLCQWVNDQCWNYSQCQPYIIQQPIQSQPMRPQGGYQMYPPSSGTSPSPPAQPSTAPPPPQLPQGQGSGGTSPGSSGQPTQPSKDELVDEVVDKVLAHPKLQPSMLQGPPGPPGRDGRDGKDIDSATLQGQLAQFREQVLAEVQAIIDANPTQQPIDREGLVDEIIGRIPVCDCDNASIGNGTNVNGSLEANRVLYFTADSCSSCFEVTNLVNSLKRSGYPITIITLTTSMAEAHQVPQVFVPSTGERALGLSNVKEFLSQIKL